MFISFITEQFLKGFYFDVREDTQFFKSLKICIPFKKTRVKDKTCSLYNVSGIFTPSLYQTIHIHICIQKSKMLEGTV